MRVAVGSTRAPKLEAVRRAGGLLAGLGLGPLDVVPVDVTDVAPVMPLSGRSLREGAEARAQRALAVVRGGGGGADYGVGLEGGLDVVDEGGRRRAFLMSWACVTDGSRVVLGAGGALEVPDRLARRVVDDGIELAEAIEALAGEPDVRSRQGAWGVLTRGLLDRARSFEIALVNAFAPFYNPEGYR